jgi:hypothetical protein
MIKGTMIRALLVLAVLTVATGAASAFSVAELEANNSMSAPQNVVLSGGDIMVTGMLSDTPDYYTFEAVYDSYVSVAVTPTTLPTDVTSPTEPIDTYWVTLFDPSGAMAGRAKSKSAIIISNMNIVQSGRYSAVVSGNSSGTTGVAHPFSYDLTIAASSKPIPLSFVPEPGSLAVLGAGLSSSVLFAFRRRKV